jgi:hypothetical protein
MNPLVTNLDSSDGCCLELSRCSESINYFELYHYKLRSVPLIKCLVVVVVVAKKKEKTLLASMHVPLS